MQQTKTEEAAAAAAQLAQEQIACLQVAPDSCSGGGGGGGDMCMPSLVSILLPRLGIMVTEGGFSTPDLTSLHWTLEGGMEREEVGVVPARPRLSCRVL